MAIMHMLISAWAHPLRGGGLESGGVTATAGHVVYSVSTDLEA